MNKHYLEYKANDFLKNTQNRGFLDKYDRRIISYISVGVQFSSNPYFSELAAHIKGHLRPEDLFRAEFPTHHYNSGLTVISFALHYDNGIVFDNSKELMYPAASWYEISYKLFNEVFTPFSGFLRELFSNDKIMFPFKSKLYNIDSSNKRPLSNWSERHIAFACGLGSFGLHGALITERGCTHRLISAITDRQFEEYGKVPEDIYHNCLYFSKNSCGKCIMRCPVDAVIPGEHIIEKCYDHEFVTNKMKALDIFGKEVTACGLCMSGVPCSTQNPMAYRTTKL